MGKTNFKDGKYHNIQFNGVEAYWASLFEPDTAFGKSEWNIRCHFKDAALVKEMKAIGLNVKDVTDGKNSNNPISYKDTLLVKKGTATAKGVKNDPPFIVGPDGRTPWTEELGNGSLVNVKASIIYYDSLGKFGVYLDGVQVVNHVARAGGFEDVSGDSDVPF